MATQTRVRTARGARTRATALGVLGALFGLGIGHFVGVWLGQGFRFDWYRYHPTSTDAASAAWAAAIAASLCALVLIPLAIGLANSTWKRLGVKVKPSNRQIGKGAHALRSLGLYGLLVPALVGIAAYLWLAVAGYDPVNPLDFPLVASAAAIVAGAVSGYVLYARTWRLLESGRLVSGNPDENVFAKVALICGRHGALAIGILLLFTILTGLGLRQLDTNVDVADVLPRGDPNTDAAHNLTQKFKSSFTLQVTFQLHTASRDLYDQDNRRLPNRQTTARPDNISDEVYVRALDQLIGFVKAYKDPNGDPSPFVASVTLADFYRLINWTIAGGNGAREQAGAFALPGRDLPGERSYASVDQGVWTAIPSTADALISPSGRQTAALVTVDPQSTLSGKEIGNWALKVREAYTEHAKSDASFYKVFTGDNSPKFSVDLPLANAHSSELAAHDFKRLLPIIAVWLVVVVFVAFRSIPSIIISLSALAISIVWTFGIMGFLEIPLNTLNLTIIPLIMGVGIDYGIHTLNEYQESRASGRSTEDTFRRLGSHGFFALFVATLNTLVGLGVMIVSPSLLIAQLGILTVLAIASSFVITITFIPAALGFVPEAKAHSYRPSPLMGSIAKGVSRFRPLFVVVLVVVSIVAFFAGNLIKIEPFGDPPRNWLPSDPLRQEHEAAIKGFYDSETDDVKANILIFEGDIKNPAAHAYMDKIEAALRLSGLNQTLPPAVANSDPGCAPGGQDPRGPQGRVITDTLRTLPFLVRVYLTVKDGVPGAAGFLALQQLEQRNSNFQSQDPYPKTEADMAATLNGIASSPLRNFGNLFYDHPSDTMAMMVFSVKAASYEDAHEVWCQVHDALDRTESSRPADIHVSFFGNTAINYLFVAKELPWVAYMSIVDNILVMAFVYIPTKLWKPTVAVGILNLLTGIWWLGVLPSLGVGLAITLTLPLVFIYAIGSDYGLHLVLHAIQEGDTENTFRTTGKGILFSGITTFGAFVIYTQMSNLAVQRTMVATAAAIPIIFAVTMIVVPLLYPVGRRFGKEHDRLEESEGTTLVEVPGLGDRSDVHGAPSVRRQVRAAPGTRSPSKPAKGK